MVKHCYDLVELEVRVFIMVELWIRIPVSGFLIIHLVLHATIYFFICQGFEVVSLSGQNVAQECVTLVQPLVFLFQSK